MSQSRKILIAYLIIVVLSSFSIVDFLKPRNKDLLSKDGAMTFLKSRNRREAVLDRRPQLDNANEECCYETCSYSEIAEYDC
jgi:hypothetical protein